jgi:hypothetical protein
MNVIEIKDLINQIGSLELSLNEQTQEYTLNQELLKNIEPNVNEMLWNEYRKKLQIQIKENSDVNLLESFLKSVHQFINDLHTHYHSFRIRLSKVNNSNMELLKICRIIDGKLDCLSEIKVDLEIKIKFYKYKISSDFNGVEKQFIKETDLEDDELELSGLPSLNTQQRYELFKRLGFDKIFDTLDTSQTTKYKLIAIIMKLSPDNAKKLHSGYYKEITSKELDFLDEYLLKQKVSLKS